MKFNALMLFAFLLPALAEGQEFRYRIGNFGFFDNREYFNPWVIDQTIFGSRIYGEAGLSLNNNNTFMAGANYLYEFGSKGEMLAPDVTLYYKGTQKNLCFYLGAFPRLHLIDMPMALMIDTLQYYRPNVEGIYIGYTRPRFSQNVWIDWTGRQSGDRRESFELGFSGRVHQGLFLWQHHFIMSHVAHTFTNIPKVPLHDNGAFALLAGLDLASTAGMDTLSISAGYLGSYDRLRGVYGFRFPKGFLADLEAVYKGFGVHATLYKGDRQLILSGDGFYRSGSYARQDIFYQHTRGGVQGRVQWSFHETPGNLDLSMSVLIRAALDGHRSFHHAN